MLRNALTRMAFACLTILSLALAGCAGTSGLPAAPSLEAGAAGETAYQMGPGDKVTINVFRHPDLSGTFELDGAGNIAMPLAGEVKANGLTTRGLEAEIEKNLSQGLLVDPQVSVEVMNYRPFYILGEVRSPGSYPYVNGMSVITAVALAGGFTYRANQDEFVLRRGGANGPAYAARGETGLLPGDVVEVQERFF
jgi:polysaccharide export outer membrane protein